MIEYYSTIIIIVGHVIGRHFDKLAAYLFTASTEETELTK